MLSHQRDETFTRRIVKTKKTTKSHHEKVTKERVKMKEKLEYAVFVICALAFIIFAAGAESFATMIGL